MPKALPRKKKTVIKVDDAAPSNSHSREEITKRAEKVRDAINASMKKPALVIYDKAMVAASGPCLSTGMPEVDELLSGKQIDGGFLRGRIVEIRGKAACAKTSLALMTVAKTQRKGGLAAWVDAEHSFDARYARKKCGVRVSELLYHNPDSGEEGLRVVRKLIQNKLVDIIVIDSVAALVPLSSLERETDGDNRPGVHAKMLSQNLQKINSVLKDDGPVVIFINQLRTNPMVMYGSKDYSPGGDALAYYASTRLDIRRVKTHVVTRGKKRIEVGFRTRLKNIKSRFVPPSQEVFLEVMYDTGMAVMKKGKKDLEEVNDE